jgi:NAD(P)-dependent dehydrogenase (short-subunit alcohol dehydrogenase family)
MNVIITGTSRGIGLNLINSFLSKTNKDNLVFAISRNVEKQILLSNSQDNLIPIKCDITNPNELKNALEIIKNKCNSIDILINNAAVIINKPFIDITANEIDYVFNANFKAPFLLIKELIPLLSNSTNAHVVNISSMGGFQGSAKFPGLSAYSSSKAALTCLTECLAVEFSASTLKFNALCLGAVQTEMLDEAFPNYVAKTNPQEMADFIYHFATNNHKFMNGKVIPVALSNP